MPAIHRNPEMLGRIQLVPLHDSGSTPIPKVVSHVVSHLSKCESIESLLRCVCAMGFFKLALISADGDNINQ